MAKWVKCPECGKIVNAMGFYLHFSQNHPDKMDKYKEIRDNISQYYVDPPEEKIKKVEEKTSEDSESVQEGKESEQKHERRESLRDIWKEPPDRGKILLEIIRDSPYLPDPRKAARVIEDWLRIKGELSPMDVYELLVKMKDVDKKEAELISEQYALAVQKAEREWLEYLSSRKPKYYIPPSPPVSSVPEISTSSFPRFESSTPNLSQFSAPVPSLQTPGPTDQVPQQAPPIYAQHIPPYAVSDNKRIELPEEVKRELEILKEKLTSLEEHKKLEQEQQKMEEIQRSIEKRYQGQIQVLQQNIEELQNLLLQKEEEKREKEEEEKRRQLEQQLLQLQSMITNYQRNFDDKIKELQVQTMLKEKDEEVGRYKSEVENLRRELSSLREALLSKQSQQPAESQSTQILLSKIDNLERQLREKPRSFIDVWEQFAEEREKYRKFAKEVLGMTEEIESGKDISTVLLGRMVKTLDKFVDMLGKPPAASRYMSPRTPEFTPLKTGVSTGELKKMIEEKKRLEEEQKKLKMELAKRQLLGAEQEKPTEKLQKIPEKPQKTKTSKKNKKRR